MFGKEWVFYGLLSMCGSTRHGTTVLCLSESDPDLYFLFIMSESIKHVSDASFEADVVNSDLPVLVDYWAAWCGPCKMIAPLLDEASKLYEGRVIIAKVNVDENPETAAKFGIRGIPTLMLFKDGKPAATKVGALSKSQLSAFLDESL
jgi:thioredoxin 1